MKTLLFALLLLPQISFSAYLNNEEHTAGSPTAHTCIIEISQPNNNHWAFLKQNCGTNQQTQEIGQWYGRVDKLQLQNEVIGKLRPHFKLVSSSSTATSITMVFQKN